MYKCADCDSVFDEPATYEEDYGYDTEIGWRSAKQEYDVCPHCNSDRLLFAECCTDCGDWFFKDEMFNDNGDYICFGCMAEREECEDE